MAAEAAAAAVRGAPAVLSNPLGVWWGLRAGADSAAPGYPVVVFGGRHADVPFGAEMGAALGRLIARQAIASIVDLSELGSSAASRRFMAAFAEALYEAHAERLHLVLNEADLWAPGHGLLASAQCRPYPVLGRRGRRRSPSGRPGRVRAVLPAARRALACASCQTSRSPETAPRSSDALDGRIAIVGTAGSGKTYAAKGYVERLLAAGARVAVVTPEIHPAQARAGGGAGTNRGSRTGEPRTRPTAGTDYGAGGRSIATCNCDRRAAGPGNPAAIAAGAIAAGPGNPAAIAAGAIAAGRAARFVVCAAARLPAPAPEMLRALAAQGGRFMDAAALAAALGKKPSGGHWNSGIVVLRNNGLIETGGGRRGGGEQALSGGGAVLRMAPTAASPASPFVACFVGWWRARLDGATRCWPCYTNHGNRRNADAQSAYTRRRAAHRALG